jgi:hypothetical protein
VFSIRALPYAIVPSSAWGACSQTCGAGMQWRSLVCLHSDGREGEVEECLGAPLPSSPGVVMGRPCMAAACASTPGSVEWFAGVYGDCSASCGSSGVQTRPVQCVNATGGAVSDALCLAHASKPNASQPCVGAPCEVFRVVASAPLPCTLPCGSGLTTSQSLTCVGTRGSLGVFESQCSGASLQGVPVQSRSLTSALVPVACNGTGVPCGSFAVSRGPATACNATCGSGGLRARNDTCVDVESGSGAVVPLSSCGLPFPGLFLPVAESCGSAPCSVPLWDVGPFGPCSGSLDGDCGGSRSRMVRCVDSATKALLPTAACVAAQLQTPPASVACSACTSSLCPSGCSGHGACFEPGACACDVGWRGEDCSVAVPTCPNGTLYVEL